MLICLIFQVTLAMFVYGLVVVIWIFLTFDSYFGPLLRHGKYLLFKSVSSPCCGLCKSLINEAGCAYEIMCSHHQLLDSVMSQTHILWQISCTV